jgi:hypothetical protein
MQIVTYGKGDNGISAVKAQRSLLARALQFT